MNAAVPETTEPRDAPSRTPIAIVGISGIFPGSPTIDDFWRHICAGTDLISDTPDSHWLEEDYLDPRYRYTFGHARGAFLPWMDFDPAEFGIPPALLKSTDTVQLLSLLAVRRLVDGLQCLQQGLVERRNVSCIIGVAAGTELIGQMAGKIRRGHWLTALRADGIAEMQAQRICDRIEDTFAEWTESTFPGLLANVVAGRIANRFDLGGTNCAVDAACASSLAAMTVAVQELQLGTCDLAISGGADALNDPFMHMCFERSQAISRSGDCRPFADGMDGTLLGEGLGFFALKRLADAEAHADPIYAVLRGYGSASDGLAKSIYAPRPAGQALAIGRAYAKAAYGPDSVELIECHGTGTGAGDAAELEGLMLAFGDADRPDRPWCGIGSIKSQIGHTKSAAGAASLAKIVCALQHRVLPPTIKVRRPDPKLPLADSPFYLNTRSRPWFSSATREHPRRAGLSSFGFGGTNFHFTLEEYLGAAPKPGRVAASFGGLLLLSADDPTTLREHLAELDGLFAANSLSVIARHSQVRFDPRARLRLAVVATDTDTARERLHRAAAQLELDSANAWSLPIGVHFDTRPQPGQLAFLFPGQGSQYLSMCDEIAMEFPQALDAWESANRAIGRSEKRELTAVAFPIPVFDDQARTEQEATLRATQWTQPALGAASVATWRLLRTLGLTPDATAGHSFGELVALHAAGCIESEASLIRLARRRGELMAEAAATAEGAMTAVQSAADPVRTLLQSAGSEVEIVNDNSPRQVVIAGPSQAIAAAEDALGAAGIDHRRLPVATAFHTRIVAAAQQGLADYLRDLPWAAAATPVFSNTTASTYPDEEAEQKARLAQQLATPVRFREMIAAMHEAGITTFLEVGPGSVLTTLVKDCLGAEQTTAIATDSCRGSSLAAFWEALGRLSVLGHRLDFDALWQPFALEAAILEPRPRSPTTVKLNGANYGAPYPPSGGADALPRPVPAPPPSSQGEAQSRIAATAVASAQTGETGSPGTPHQSGAAAATTAQVASAPESAAPVPTFLPESRSTPNDQGAPMKTMRTDRSSPEPVQTAAVARTSPVRPDVAAEVAGHPLAEPSALIAFQQLVHDAQVQFQATLSNAHLEYLHTSSLALQALAGVPAPAGIGAPDPAVLPMPQAPTTTSAAPAAAPWEPVPQPDFAAGAPVAQPSPLAPMAAVMSSALAPGVEPAAAVLPVQPEPTAAATSGQQPEVPLVEHGSPAEGVAVVDAGMADTAATAADEASPASSPPTVEIAPPADFQSTLLNIVAELTGYPTEMLDLDLDLEAGLGIDSIKRVEILSALQAHFPALADQDTGQMANLQTLGEIVVLYRSASEDAATTEGPVGVAPSGPFRNADASREAAAAAPL